ncbi:MAG TPA: DUF434 domain-containing protein [Polyangiaceae bacterium]|nr:DUF434 domain-containing protein [Polyangiaceae bacterium]
MHERRSPRGPAPADRTSFGPEGLERLRAAVFDHSWLLSRAYAPEAALKLVGDRYQLVARQRAAVSKSACADGTLAARVGRRLAASELGGRALRVDTFNACIGVEVALSGGPLFVGRDGACRDLAGVHGSYGRVLETSAALDLLIDALARGRPGAVAWYLDRPVSNSGALAGLLRERFERLGLAWGVELVDDADRHVVAPGAVTLSADGAVLDASERWFDVAGWVVRERVPDAWVVDLSSP